MFSEIAAAMANSNQPKTNTNDYNCAFVLLHLKTTVNNSRMTALCRIWPPTSSCLVLVARGHIAVQTSYTTQSGNLLSTVVGIWAFG
eukprot:3381214-Amphidinium_carterae.1